MIHFIVLLLALIVPFLIVGLWRKRPIRSFIVATIIAIILHIIVIIAQLFLIMMRYGQGDPQLMAGIISEALTNSILILIVYLPILLLFQWIIRRVYRKKDAPNLKVDTFE